MAEPLETIVATAAEVTLEKPHATLKQEIADAFHHYPSSLIDYTKILLPALAVSSIPSGIAQWGGALLGYTSPAEATAAAYLLGYPAGYATAFTLEYFKNKGNYPLGFFSKKMAEFAGTFIAADYVADLLFFTPEFIALNSWMVNNTSIHPFVRNSAAWYGAGALWISGMALMHPIARRLNTAINKEVRAAYNAVRPKAIGLYQDVKNTVTPLYESVRRGIENIASNWPID